MLSEILLEVFPADILRLVLVGKTQVSLLTLTMALFYSGDPVSHGSVTVSQHAQYEGTENRGSELELSHRPFNY